MFVVVLVNMLEVYMYVCCIYMYVSNNYVLVNLLP